jgi:hypothetical protein
MSLVRNSLAAVLPLAFLALPACAPPDSRGLEDLGTKPGDEHCANGVRDAGESGVDCGGECAACPPGGNRCSNGVVDPGETGIDCGGDCAACPGDPTNSGCASDRVAPPPDAGNCTCDFATCDATEITCNCSGACAGGAADCLINCTGGSCTTTDPGLGTCAMACTEPTDLNPDVECSFTQ